MLGARFDVVTQSSLAIPEAEEPHDTFVENALAKARHASRAANLPALADDSGLCVDALGGEPGVHSAYYAGRDGSREERDARNNAKLLASLKGERDGYYCCVMVLVRHAEDPRPLIAEGLWHGEIARTPRGSNGFGYDPLFLLPKLGRTAAELEPAEKNRISHRALALRRLLELLDADHRA
ncbi:MAG TPA: RdgB/HAM1 family non-canonical purine NTP pyrophosphatase [Burkholderiales bacterium]|nr:RdgB/HAM1 family non-canonical purine NTP pyrophosphatase [Burkholderiales bacterium]